MEGSLELHRGLLAGIVSGLFAALALAFPSVGPAHIGADIVAEDFKIKSTTPGIELFVRNKWLAATQSSAPIARFCMFTATLASELVFDLPVDAHSMCNFLPLPSV